MAQNIYKIKLRTITTDNAPEVRQSIRLLAVHRAEHGRYMKVG